MEHPVPGEQGFHHEAVFYAGADDYVVQLVPLIRDAITAAQKVLVAVPAAELQLLREELGADSAAVYWVEMTGVGGNPARIIPLWREFVARYRPGASGLPPVPLFGIGQPIYPERSAAELVEAQRHEKLLNQAFGGVAGFTLLCPYDTEALPRQVIDEAMRSHRYLGNGKMGRPSAAYTAAGAGPFDGALEAAASSAVARGLEPPVQLSQLTHFITTNARRHLGARVQDLLLALDALALELCPAGGRIWLWREEKTVIVQLQGTVQVEDPLAGREWPAPSSGPGRALWLAHQLCDLVQVRCRPGISVARLHMRAG